MLSSASQAQWLLLMPVICYFIFMLLIGDVQWINRHRSPARRLSIFDPETVSIVLSVHLINRHRRFRLSILIW